MAATYKNMGIVEKELGNFEKALELYGKALEIEIQSLARKLFREAHNSYVQCLGPMHPDTQKAAQDLAQI